MIQLKPKRDYLFFFFRQVRREREGENGQPGDKIDFQDSN